MNLSPRRSTNVSPREAFAQNRSFGGHSPVTFVSGTALAAGVTRMYDEWLAAVPLRFVALSFRCAAKRGEMLRREGRYECLTGIFKVFEETLFLMAARIVCVVRRRTFNARVARHFAAITSNVMLCALLIPPSGGSEPYELNYADAIYARTLPRNADISRAARLNHKEHE